MKFLSIFIIFLDLSLFSFYGAGFSGNIEPFSYTAPDNHEIFAILKNDPELYRILPFDLKSEKLPNWSLPNANIMYDLDSVACYTPLVGKNYRERLLGLEVVDDSLGFGTPNEEAIGKNVDIVKLLNVKYIVSDKTLNESFLEEIAAGKGIFLYMLKGYFPRVFFSYDIYENIKPIPLEHFKIVRYKDGYLNLEVTADRDGFIVFSENYYPGWRVYVDHGEKNLIKVKGFLQGVSIKKGDHRVSFIYSPYDFLLKK